jgi:hypothetical protein
MGAQYIRPGACAPSESTTFPPEPLRRSTLQFLRHTLPGPSEIVTQLWPAGQRDARLHRISQLANRLPAAPATP